MKKRFLGITIFLIVGLIIIYFTTMPSIEKWVYDLPNGYVIKKTSETEVMLGKYINDSFEVKYNSEQIGIDEYIAEFAHSDSYISLKCLEPTDNTVRVKFYIIDSKNDDIYGPYYDEETYNTVFERIVDEKIGNWIKTINKPNR